MKDAMVAPPALAEYEPPTGDEPLDEIECALVRALARIIARQIREEAVATSTPAGRRVG